MTKHADYPHTPGMLYDCEACATVCFCGPDGDVPCIYHELMQESEDTAKRYDKAVWYSQDA